MKVIHHSGKRRRAIAKATLTKGKGRVRLNNQMIDILQPEMLRLKLQEPLVLAGATANEVDVNIKVAGGGVSSQTEAARVALSKCLVSFNKKLEKTFLAYDRFLLVSDSRRKEPCKPNDSSARSKRQKSYR